MVIKGMRKNEESKGRLKIQAWTPLGLVVPFIEKCNKRRGIVWIQFIHADLEKSSK